jgi:hypothetical protein
MIQALDETGNRFFEVDVVLPEGVVGVDEKGLGDHLTESYKRGAVAVRQRSARIAKDPSLRSGFCLRVPLAYKSLAPANRLRKQILLLAPLAQDFACGLPLASGSLTPANRLNFGNSLPLA